jgi:flagellar biogenesis protein FliO
MDDSLSRLLWALPLVLGVGVLGILALKRWLVLLGRAPSAGSALALQQSLALSERATAHLLQVDGRRLLVVETASAVSTVELDAPAPRRWSGALPGGRGWR